ncbi:carboxypeptidase-like regulatory domain-containing protein [Hymenobacter wooponensis]|uniref:Carboxypeptidase-like regulatory domain-containing protein n=1 Tax=Hymenobacter wooponensis TaxID=1525360 RepID=A0A4Z0MI50_9BACT|nr:carboxypeptidase-like regulatory domain-containing protein [Hymenobacter wooponensis]TGD78865.1 carboxypeptidase-like regulatory domain-containing protein [Hymenobacter wooponensis]
MAASTRLRIAVALLCWLLASTTGLGQVGTLTGTVRDSVTQAPLELASLFLANTTYGASTNEKGQFSLPNVPVGQYDLVISYLGYKLYKRSITVKPGPQTLPLLLTPNSQQLREVVIRPNPNRESDYQRFVQTFLGQSAFSRQCRIRNPKDVYVDYDSDKNELTATSAAFVQVDNDALGYRVKYYGLKFTQNFREQYVVFYGYPVFEEMKARNERQLRRWVANREQAYRGSLTHFLHSIYTSRVTSEGFLVQKMRIVPNRKFPRADSLAKALRQARRNSVFSSADQDSLSRWVKVPRAFSMLYTAPRPLDSLRRVQPDSGRVWLRFRDYLQVTYLKESPDPAYPAARPISAAAAALPKGQISTLVLLQPEIEIQKNGQLVVPLGVFTDGYWGFEKMGEFLPLDYTPAASAP